MADLNLKELELLYGITVDRGKIGGAEEVESSLVTLLAAMGLEINDPADLPALLARSGADRWRQILDPLLAVPEGAGRIVVEVRLPEADSVEYNWLLVEENGNRHTGTFNPQDLEVAATFRGGAESFASRHLVVEFDLPCGYHQLTVTAPGRAESSAASLTLVVAPSSCYTPPGISGEDRIWGLSLHLHAIRSRRNWGMGDFSDLREILAWVAEQGAGILNLAPLHAVSYFETGGGNPYNPACRSMLNLLFLDLEAMVDFRESDEVRNQVGNPKFQARLASLREQEELDYQAVAETKFEVFRLLWQHFSADHLEPETDRGREFRGFQGEGGELLRFYSIYSALQEKFRSGEQPAGQGWREWPPEYRDSASRDVAEFAAEHRDQVEFYQYLQWQAQIQLVAVGRRSMELGLKLGLLAELAFGPERNGFETWYYRGLYAGDLVHAVPGGVDRATDPALGLPLFFPARLRELRYAPLVEAFRQAMRPAGGLVLRGLHHYFQSSPGIPDGDPVPALSMHAGFAEILAIVTLESRRNRCLVAADSPDGLPPEYERLLREKGIFPHLFALQRKNRQGNWPAAADYPANAMLSVAAPFLVNLKSFWDGRDLTIKAENGIFADLAAEEEAVVSRASDRAHLLITLRHEGLLPGGYSVDPLSVAEITPDLTTALHLFLARTPARLQLLSLNDLLGMERQAEPPSFADQSFWLSRYPLVLEKIIGQSEIVALFSALCRERGIGVVRPSAPAAARHDKEGMRIPLAFYRLQLHRECNFLQAAELVEYLSRLGISHLYASPFLQARPGSTHGYDIINHAELNPEIGSREDFETLISALERHGMALLLDIVPNHMGVGADNHWWMDVLENGEAALHAGYFDINWEPLQPELKGRLLLPVLGDHYGKVLENGELRLAFAEGSGSFTVRYHQQLFPVAPKTYAVVLRHDLQRLEDRLGSEHNGYLELQNLISAFINLPPREENSAEMLRTRHRNKEVNKRILARLCRETPEVRQFIAENLILFNGEPGRPASFDLLHNLLEGQAYRLAYWRVAAEEINYRRFFDINDLAGLRMENPEVFRETHKLVVDLISTGKLDGLRVDHPDGLYDPGQYFRRLQSAVASDFPENQAILPTTAEEERKISLYVVAEKILADFEALPADWPVQGTTGYDFSSLLGGLFVDAQAEAAMTFLYHRFIGGSLDCARLVYDSKKLIIRNAMAGELNVLTSMLYRLAQADRQARDFPLNWLRQALTEIVAYFPVYRTYISSGRIRQSDIDSIDQALLQARNHAELEDTSVFDFVRSVLLLQGDGEEGQRKQLDFVKKLQQYTGPVMAKGLEDTAFYIYNRLLSLNEVGGNPQRFGVSLATFHRANRERQHRWPQAMLNSSTHDSKRSEDVRARISVLSEMSVAWEEKVTRWSAWNLALKSKINDQPAPSSNDEYAFYQNLLGVWPTEPPTAGQRQVLIARLNDCMLKTVREAKENSSWINPDAAYEEAMRGFVAGVLAEDNQQFLDDFASFLQEVAWFGSLSSLSQVLLKLTAPGVPDIYQGNEIWRFCLVDPDNRRLVDFARRRQMLEAIMARSQGGQAEKSEFLQELLDSLGDGRAKMYVTKVALQLRKSRPEVFARGDYLPLEVTGSRSRYLCAFARRHGQSLVVVAVPMLYRQLGQGQKTVPLAEAVWGDTSVMLPPELAGGSLENLYTGATVKSGTREKPFLRAAQLFESWPLALLAEKATSGED